MIYLAVPYTDNDPTVVEDRFKRVCAFAARLIQQGADVFSPISHSHPIVREDPTLPRSFETWEHADLTILGICDKLVVLKLPGWSNSYGIKEEIAAAEERNIPVEYVDP